MGGSTGADRSAVDMAEALSENGCDVRLCVGNIGRDAARWVLERLGPQAVLKPPVRFAGRETGARAGSLGRRIRSLARCVRIRREAARADIVLVNGLYGRLVACSAGVDLRKATLVVRESPGHCRSHFWRRFGARGEDVLRRYGRLIFVSRDSLRAWERVAQIGPDQERCVIPNTCDEQVVVRLRRRAKGDVRRVLGLHATGFVVVCVGSVIHRKGQ